MQNKKYYEVIIHGRGGQGAKTTAEILVQAAIKQGSFIQAFPNFGPERTGAPMKAYVRISNEPIRTHESVIDPDCVLVLDETILDSVDVTKGVTGTEAIIVNSKKEKNELTKKTNFDGNIVSVDASGLSKQIIGENRPNTVILGKFSFVSEKVKIENIMEAFRQKYEKKIGEEETAKNIEAIQKAYNIH